MQLEGVQILALSDFDINRVPKFLHKFLTFDEEKLKERWDACNGCEFLNDKLMCKKCGCFMRLKSRVKSTKCPIGKWDKI